MDGRTDPKCRKTSFYKTQGLIRTKVPNSKTSEARKQQYSNIKYMKEMWGGGEVDSNTIGTYMFVHFMYDESQKLGFIRPAEINLFNI